MPKKKKSKDSIDNADDIIIGYNTIKKDKPPNDKKKNKKATKKKKRKKQKSLCKEGQAGNNKTKNKSKKKKVQGKKKKKKRGIFKKVLKILIKLIIVLAIATGIILFLFVSPVFNIQDIEISGANEISESVYLAMAGVEIGDNIFEIDKISGESTIKKEPYVEDVQINRIYPNKIEINVTERVVCYIIEEDGKFFYLDKNGYILEISFSPIDLLKIVGITSKIGELEIGQRLSDEDLAKFNDIIKIRDAIQNNDIEAKLTSINIADDNNYILEFLDENKTIMLGKATDLSAKMAWVNLFIKNKKEDKRNYFLKFR